MSPAVAAVKAVGQAGHGNLLTQYGGWLQQQNQAQGQYGAGVNLMQPVFGSQTYNAANLG